MFVFVVPISAHQHDKRLSFCQTVHALLPDAYVVFVEHATHGRHYKGALMNAAMTLMGTGPQATFCFQDMDDDCICQAHFMVLRSDDFRRANGFDNMTRDCQFLKLKKRLKFNETTQHGLSQLDYSCLLYTSPSPRDRTRSRMPSSA